MYLIEELSRIVKLECNQRRLDPNVISAIIQVESAWRPNSARYESRFNWLYIPSKFSKLHGVTDATEISFQKHSWGLMQVMGGTARGLSYAGWLPDLCDPEIGVSVGCDYFQSKCAQYLDVRDQFAVYNRGSLKRKLDKTYVNQDYVDKCMDAYAKLLIK